MRDMLMCIERILEIGFSVRKETAGTAPELHDSILYRFIILGEAAGRVSEETRSKHPQIPWQRAKEMRHFLVHVYDGVKWDIVWETVHRDLPPLEVALRAAIGMTPPPDRTVQWGDTP